MIDGGTLGDAKRPHMLWGVPKDEYIYSANTASNSITVLGHKDGGVKAIIANVGKAPHAAQPNRSIQTASTSRTSRRKPLALTASQTAARPLPRWCAQWPEMGDRALSRSESRTGPGGRQSLPESSPGLCGFSKDGRYMLATLFNGGSPDRSPGVERVKGWGKNNIAENGCGFATSPSGNELYVTAGNQQSSWLYVFDTVGEPKLVATHNLSKVGQDSHGIVVDQPATRCGLRTA